MARNAKHIWTCSGIVFTFSVAFFTGGYLAENSSSSPSYAGVLFALPLVVQLAGLINLYFRYGEVGEKLTFYYVYLVTMALCVGSYCVLWIEYNRNVDPNTLSRLTGLFLMTLLTIILVVNFAVMMPLNRQRLRKPESNFWKGVVGCLEDLRLGVQRMPFWALLHFLAVFLSVSYLFAFAFAFHDRAAALTSDKPHPPLYRAKLPSYKLAEESFVDLTAGEKLCFNLYFEEDESVLMHEPRDIQKAIYDKLIRAGSEEERRQRVHNKNHDEITAIMKLLDKLADRVQMVQLTIIGHADDKQPNRTAKYENNYYVSTARAESVRTVINNLFNARNEYKFKSQLVWLTRGVSNERLPYSENYKEQYCDDEVEDGKMVRVTVHPIIGSSPLHMSASSGPPFERLNLQDFIALAISPGGSNDTTLTTPHAKFLLSLVNICQLFFFVGFFNALLSLKNDDRAPAAAAEPRDG